MSLTVVLPSWIALLAISSTSLSIILRSTASFKKSDTSETEVVFIKKGFLKNVEKTSRYFHKELQKLKQEYPKVIKDVRGMGLLVGIKISQDQTKFIKKLSDNKLLTVRAAENVVRLLPPLTVKKKNIDQAVAILKKVCKTYR